MTEQPDLVPLLQDSTLRERGSARGVLYFQPVLAEDSALALLEGEMSSLTFFHCPSSGVESGRPDFPLVVLVGT